MQTRLLVIVMVSILSYLYVGASAQELRQDTVTLNLPDVEKRFVEQSLTLIAAHFDVTTAEEQVLDTKLWYNPQISYSQSLYDPQTKEYLKSSSQYDVQVSQLFSIAGRHSNTVKLTRLNAQKSEWQFKEVVRSLKLQLYKDFETIYADERKAKLYDYETEQLNSLLSGEKQQQHLGAVAENEVIRLTAEIQDLNNSSIQNYNELLDAEQELKTLLNYNQNMFVVAVVPGEGAVPQVPSLDAVISTAEQNRPDFQLSKTEVEYERQNVSLQRSLGAPDLTLTYEHDLAANYTPNYNGIGVALPLPLFNRNQHQVRAARAQYDKAVVQDSLFTFSLHNEVAQAYSSFLNINKTLSSLSVDYPGQLDQLNRNAISNYSKRYINLVDFLDQVRTYTASEISLIELKHQYHDAINTMNYVTGTTLLK